MLALQQLLPAAFRRLCVETHLAGNQGENYYYQPPSGGCVLKLKNLFTSSFVFGAAAFGRLCVETYKLRV